MAQTQLYSKVRKWEASISDDRDYFPYKNLLDELCFQAELRYRDYQQYTETDGLFLTRLNDWLNNVDSAKQQQALFKLLASLIFVDRGQMVALYRDAFRRIIVPWLDMATTQIDEMVSPDFIENRRAKLVRYQLASIT